MAGIPVAQIRKGQVVKIDGVAYKVIDHSLLTRGNLRGIVNFTLRNIQTGKNENKRFNSNSNVETLWASKRTCEYLYEEGSGWVFMDKDSYEQFTLDAELVGDVMKYIPHNTEVQVLYIEEKPVDIDLPATVTLSVIEADPAIRGDTATNVTKRVVCETGLEIKAPQHIDVGDKVSVDTRTGDFMGRVKD
ncbi:MAG: elongation factor P [Planctomycetota bacterium]